jgi:Fe2+ or Zn2+ uptake regulation protein
MTNEMAAANVVSAFRTPPPLLAVTTPPQQPGRKRTRNTGQRKAILCAVRCLPGHPTAAEVFAHVRAQGGYPRLSLATVYRALEALVAQGDIIEMRVGGVGRYDGGPRPHHHVVCRGCGRMTDVPPLLPSSVLSDLEQASGYRVDPCHPIQFPGLCPACAP